MLVRIKITDLIMCFILVIMYAGCSEINNQTVRVRQNFNSDWKFAKGDFDNAQASDFDDSDWRQLSLPHDWAIEGPFSKEVYFQGGFLPYPGTGWYRKTFNISSEGRIVLLEFDGVMMNAKVWINGQYAGGWAFGYSSFAIDITQYLKSDQDNVVAVRVENIDFSSRWYPGSGIYRNVWLTLTEPVHVAHWGTYVTTPEVSDEKALVKIETEIVNQAGQMQDVELETSIADPQGNIVASTIKSVKTDPDSIQKVVQHMEILNPERWDVDNPHMYKAISRILHNKMLIDDYNTPFGIRTFRFDANEGFFLNGRSMKLNGVNLHHDLGPLGAAVSARAIERQLQIMQQMGVNAIRTAHNPPAPELLELCDKMGILVMDEAFDEWRQAKHNVQNSYSMLFNEWAEKDMHALVKRDRNHPSIILWSTGNEVPELGTADGKKSAKMLADICRELDPTRPVSSGIHLSITLDQELMDIFDVAGFNYWHEQLPEIHKKYPQKPLLVTEASAVLSTRGVYQFPVQRIYSGFDHESMQISSYDNINTGFGALPDVEFKLQDENEWLAGQFVWAGFDYHGEPDPFEDRWPAHSSYFGIVDMCGFPKDRYYLYQSVWTDEPMIHVLPHWNWQGREGEVTPVYVYSNCNSAELFVNGNSMGVRKKQSGEYRLRWDDVIYKPGSLRVVGYDNKDNILVEKEVKTAGPAARIVMEADRQTIRAGGEDLAFVKVKVLDSENNFCPTADNLVRFDLEGQGTIAAVGNGNPVSHESYQAARRKLFNGLCLLIVRSNDTSGAIQITARADGLEEHRVIINSSN